MVIKPHASSDGSYGKESACKAGALDLIPGLGRSPGERNGNPFQYSCLENPMDRGAWWAIVHGVTKAGTTEQLIHTHPQAIYKGSLLSLPCQHLLSLVFLIIAILTGVR